MFSVFTILLCGSYLSLLIFFLFLFVKEQMMQLRDVYSVEEMTDYNIMEQVLGMGSYSF